MPGEQSKVGSAWPGLEKFSPQLVWGKQRRWGHGGGQPGALGM